MEFNEKNSQQTLGAELRLLRLETEK